MKSENDKIKNIFNSKLNSFEPELPSSLWEKIESDLNANQTHTNLPGKNATLKKSIQWFSAAAAVILAIFLFYPKESDLRYGNTFALFEQALNTEILEERKEQPKTTAQTDNTESIRKSNTPNKQLIALKNSSSINLLSASKEDKESAILKSSTTPPNESPPEEEVFITQEMSDPSFEKELSKEIANLKANNNKEDLLAYGPPIDDRNKKQKSQSVQTKSSDSNGLEVGIGGSSGFFKSNETQLQLRHSMLYNEKNKDEIKTSYKNQLVNLEHNKPISFGIAVNKKLSNRISIETGIIYTYLLSRAKSVPGSEYKLRDSQHFHYLGVPLSVNYKLAEWKKFQFYTSIGGVIQKDFYGRMNTVQSIAGQSETKELIKKNISQDHPQYSLTGSLGLSYPIYNKLSLYTNFGTSYYLDAKNDYETIYSDRKWIFNLNLGVRFGF